MKKHYKETTAERLATTTLCEFRGTPLEDLTGTDKKKITAAWLLRKEAHDRLYGARDMCPRAI